MTHLIVTANSIANDWGNLVRLPTPLTEAIKVYDESTEQ